MIKRWTHYIAAGLFAAVLGVTPVVAPDAFAQARSAGMGMSANNMLEVNCLDSVRRLETLVRELETFAEQLQFCNNNEQVYTGGGCTSLAGLEHAWLSDPSDPTSLVFTDNGIQVGDAIDVIIGQPGEPAVCPSDTAEEGSVPPPSEPEPAPSNCSAPWGATVNHGSSVTAYQSASVPSGSSCASQNRSCNNGSLSGSYTHQSCSVAAAPSPSPEPPMCCSTCGAYCMANPGATYEACSAMCQPPRCAPC